jgi:hypothetical protein
MIAFQFSLPEVEPTFGKAGELAGDFFVAMPKTAVHKDYLFEAREH